MEKFLNDRKNNIISEEIGGSYKVINAWGRGGKNDPTEYMVSYVMFSCFKDARFARFYYWGKNI